MQKEINRRDLLKFVAVGGAAYLAAPGMSAFCAWPRTSKLISPGCRRSKVKVAKIYLGIPQSHYPNPDLDLKKDPELEPLKNRIPPGNSLTWRVLAESRDFFSLTFPLSRFVSSMVGASFCFL